MSKIMYTLSSSFGESDFPEGMNNAIKNMLLNKQFYIKMDDSNRHVKFISFDGEKYLSLFEMFPEVSHTAANWFVDFEMHHLNPVVPKVDAEESEKIYSVMTSNRESLEKYRIRIRRVSLEEAEIFVREWLKSYPNDTAIVFVGKKIYKTESQPVVKSRKYQ
ncbi:MAG: hypothetical protein [Caudoviricetes sp.]|nr:MAG: hypothetical protein [Caudoviricetes sp.]